MSSRDGGRPLARPTVTVAICTRDRAGQLAGCLDSIDAQTDRPDQILVVDNASCDDSPRRATAGRADYVHEPRPGVRFARNRALETAHGKVVAFLDDDCRADPAWIETVRAVFMHDPEAGCCTGPVRALVTDTPAQALMERRGGFDKGREARRFTRDSHCAQLACYPVQAWMFGTGANMAFVREDLLSAGGFSKELRWGEDLDAFFRILRHDRALRYEPAALVHHEHVRDYRELRGRLYRWGWAYTAYLSRLVWDEPLYRRRALREIAGSLRWHWRERCMPALLGRGDFPLDLALAELAGGFAGIPGYLLARVGAKAG